MEKGRRGCDGDATDGGTGDTRAALAMMTSSDRYIPFVEVIVVSVVVVVQEI